MTEETAWQKIDWQCGVKHYADQLGLTVYRKPSCKGKERWDINIHITETDAYITGYYFMEWDAIGAMLNLVKVFIDMIKESKVKGIG